jgi:hypothetical protein
MDAEPERLAALAKLVRRERVAAPIRRRSRG